MDPKDSGSLALNDTPARRKEPCLIEIGLGWRNITVVENNLFLPRNKRSGKPDIVVRVLHLDLHDLHFIPAPELLLSGPLVAHYLLIFLERANQGKEIPWGSLGIKPGPERIFESMH
jgi:hypothetical protein